MYFEKITNPKVNIRFSVIISFFLPDVNQHMIGELERMMSTADGQYREVIQRALDEVRRD